MPRKLNEKALELAALASQLERSLLIAELWPTAFKNGRVKVMTLHGYKRGGPVNYDYGPPIKKAWLQDSQGRKFQLTMAQYERLKL